MGERLAEDGDALERRLEALSPCLGKVPPRHRDFVESYYRDRRPVNAQSAMIRGGPDRYRVGAHWP